MINEYAQQQIDRIAEECKRIKPLVVMHTLTYNHEKYLAATLDGFLMQQTSFPTIAVVHDDASTDGTANVLRSYAERYPEKIFPIYEKENQYSKAGALTAIMNAADAATGAPYTAMCEGDDYWIDPQKLQKQVDFLEVNPDYSMCFSSFKTVDEDNKELEIDEYKEYIEMSYTDNDILKLIKGNYILTCTVLLRSHIFSSKEYSMSKYKLDYSLFLSAAWNGRLKFFEESMSAYRIVQAGMMKSKHSYVAFACNQIQKYFFDLWLDKEYRKFNFQDVVSLDLFIINKLIEELIINKRNADKVKDILKTFKQNKRTWLYLPVITIIWLNKMSGWKMSKFQTSRIRC